MTWEVVEDIGGDTFEGFGIGDGKTIAVGFATDGSSVVALYIANPDGSYSAMWADEGDKTSAQKRCGRNRRPDTPRQRLSQLIKPHRRVDVRDALRLITTAGHEATG